MKIIVKVDNNQTKDFIIDKKLVLLGRGKNCHVSIPSDHISREHLQIEEKNGAIFIKDLTLSNWVFYNDEKLVKNHETQYFDFASLVLPGNISIKIELDRPSEITEERIRDVSTSLKPRKATSTRKIKVDNKKIDIYNTPLEQINNTDTDDLKDIGKKDKGLSKEALLLMIIIFACIGGYFVYDIMVASNQSATVSQARTGKSVKKINSKKNRLIKKPVRDKKPVKPVKTKTKMELEFEKLVVNKQKCFSSFSLALCRSIFKNKAQNEGILTKGKTLHILKNKLSRISQIFLKNPQLLNTAKRSPWIDIIVAGESILQPDLLKKIEKQKISKILIHVFSLKSGRAIYNSTYQLDPSYYRRYSLSDYELAYKGISQKMDTNFFERKFVKLLSKK